MIEQFNINDKTLFDFQNKILGIINKLINEILILIKDEEIIMNLGFLHPGEIIITIIGNIIIHVIDEALIKDLNSKLRIDVMDEFLQDLSNTVKEIWKFKELNLADIGIKN